MPSPLFTMLQLNDVHVSLGEDPRNTQGKLRALAERIGRDPDFPQPDLTLLTGDLIDIPGEPALRRFTELAGPILAGRVLAVPGNHDVHPPEDPAPADPFWRVFSTSPLGEAVRFRGVSFILLNDADGDKRDFAWSDARNQWLAETLDHCPEGPVIVAAHVPLVALRDPEPLAASFDFPTWKNQDPEASLLRLVDRHAGKIAAVLSGHLHLTGRVERHGVSHIVASGTMSWPYDVGRYDFFSDRIEVRMAALPNDAIDPGALGRHPFSNGVHDRHGRDFNDARHPAPADYIRGLPEERAFIIPLEGAKRIRSA